MQALAGPALRSDVWSVQAQDDEPQEIAHQQRNLGKIEGQMNQTVLDMNGLSALKANPPMKSVTVQVNGEVAKEVMARGNEMMREMTSSEISDLATFLGENPAALKGPFCVDRSLVCPSCSRNLTFLDFVQTIAGSGSHSKKMMGDILAGRNGIWITFAGTEEVRTITCLACGHHLHRANHNYYSSAYGYQIAV